MAAALTLSAHPGTNAAPAAAAAVPAANTTTLPSTTSSAAEYVNNWSNLTAIWNASKLNQNDTGTYGPRIAELRASNQWSTNQIVDYTGFFADATDSVKYDQATTSRPPGTSTRTACSTPSTAHYNSSSMPITVKRDYVMVPNEPFLVARYTFTNPSSTTSYSWKVLDQVHLNNTSSSTNVSASYDSTRNALFGNMTASGQDVVALGALQTPTSYQAGNDSDCTASDTTASAWCQFDTNGTLDDNASESTPNVDLGFQNTVTIAPSSSPDALLLSRPRLDACPTRSRPPTRLGPRRAATGSRPPRPTTRTGSTSGRTSRLPTRASTPRTSATWS